jgi:hypothetical protein
MMDQIDKEEAVHHDGCLLYSGKWNIMEELHENANTITNLSLRGSMVLQQQLVLLLTH